MTKRKKINDKFAKREAQKYEQPIASREYILEYLQKRAKPAGFEHLVKALNINTEGETEALRRRLRAMIRDGQLASTRRDSYCLVDKADLMVGRVMGHPDGFGFFIPDEKSADLFLSAAQMRQVMHGDRVLVRKTAQGRRGKREAVIIDVLVRSVEQVVGRLHKEGHVYFVDPDNRRIAQDIVIAEPDLGKAKAGDIVVAGIIGQPTRHSPPTGKILEVLGPHMAPGMETDIAIRAHNIPHLWPEAVLEEVNQFKPNVLEKDKKNRTDLRDLPLVTIDGEDARDFDDAVYCEKTDKGWRLIVAIADVSHYVKPNMALDDEAHLRGNSVYFPDKVVPMLPEILSNGLCSLVPEQDRLCMVCDMSLDKDGKVKRYRFYRAVMNSHARLTYTEVAALLEGKAGSIIEKKYQSLLPHIQTLYALYKILAKRREKRGAIAFDTTETKILFSDNKRIEKIVPYERNDAHRLIEECMLLANVSAAEFVLSHKIPNLFRIHERPPVEKLTDLRSFLGSLGLQLEGGEEPQPKDYGKVLAQIKGRPDEHLIQTVLLYSLQQAVYSPENRGHFGLAYPAYAHFTSPIRRYPDLLLHRAIGHILDHQPVDTFIYSAMQMVQFGEFCSMTERRADEATRDAVSWLKCEYMQQHVGESFNGVITSVTSFGLFVELEDIFVEGLVHVTSLPNDYYHYDPVKHHLLAERSNQRYRLGDKVRVRVVRVDLDEKKIDFNLVVSD